ncbi:MAG TPA: F0F1 ATP synthase subunit gamma, partial [Terriglobia bacterium]|nr:F0F1 ATP synthase subunit gamma [Terriglobia bacterium]
THPLLEVRPEERILLLVVTADRGLCGGFNTNLLKAAVNFLAQHRDKEVQLYTAGKKGRDFFRRRNLTLVGESEVASAKEIATSLWLASTPIFSRS